jgi:hypothetical protein
MVLERLVESTCLPKEILGPPTSIIKGKSPFEAENLPESFGRGKQDHVLAEILMLVIRMDFCLLL